MIEVTGGNLALGGRPILRTIDLSVRKGEVVARARCQRVRQVDARARADGSVDLDVRRRAHLRHPLNKFREWRRVGYVPQRVTAASGVPATVAEVVASGRLSRRRLLLPMRAADRAAVRAAIDAVELTERAGDAVGQLSGGQQQRVLIARALAGEPELFVLDEPNAGVDHHNQIGLAETLRPMVTDGATVLLVLHELGPLAPLIDRAIALRDGRIVYDGPVPDDDLLDDFHEHHHQRHQTDHVPMRLGWDL